MQNLIQTFESLAKDTTIYPIKVSSYKELCKLLDLKEQTNPNSKAAQLKSLEQFCLLKQQGRAFRIDTIFSEPIIELKFDKKSKFQELLVKNLLDCLLLREENDSYEAGAIRKTYLTRKELATELGLCDLQFYETRPYTNAQRSALLAAKIESGDIIQDTTKQMLHFIEQFFQLNSTAFYNMLESMVWYIQKNELMFVNLRYQQLIDGVWTCTTEDADLRYMELRRELSAKFQLSGMEISDLFYNLGSGKVINSPAKNFTVDFVKKFELSYFHRPVYELVYTKRILQLLVAKNYPDYKELRAKVVEKQLGLHRQAYNMLLAVGGDTEEKSRIAWEVLVRECIL